MVEQNINMAELEQKYAALADGNAKLNANEKAFLKKMGPAVEAAIKKAGLTVPVEGVLGQLALESASRDGQWGQSYLAQNANNFAGLTAGSGWKGPLINRPDRQGEKAGGVTINQDFRKYGSVQEFADDYVKFVQKPRYALALEQKDPYSYALELGKAGYHNDNDATYAGYVQARAFKMDPSKEGVYKGLAGQYKDVGDEERARRISSKAKDYISSAGSDEERKEREQEHVDFMHSMMEKNPVLGFFLMLFSLIMGILTGQRAEGILNYIAEHSGQNSVDLADKLDGSRQVSYDFDKVKIDVPKEWTEAWNSEFTPAVEASMKSMLPAETIKLAEGMAANGSMYQEIRGNSYESYGVFMFKDNSGNVRYMPQSTGGAGRGSFPGASTGTGAGMIDPRYPDAKEIPHYTITGYRERGDALGAFSFDMLSNGKDSVDGTGRGLFRVHVGTNNSPKSLGCGHVSGKHSQFLIDNISGRSLEMQVLPTLDAANILRKEVEKQKAQQQEVKPEAEPKPSEPQKVGGSGDNAAVHDAAKDAAAAFASAGVTDKKPAHEKEVVEVAIASQIRIAEVTSKPKPPAAVNDNAQKTQNALA
jgi:hypothetical protein